MGHDLHGDCLLNERHELKFTVKHERILPVSMFSRLLNCSDISFFRKSITSPATGSSNRFPSFLNKSMLSTKITLQMAIIKIAYAVDNVKESGLTRSKHSNH